MRDAVAWYIVVQVAGLATWPLVARALAPLADRGWAATKTAGLLGLSAGVGFLEVLGAMKNEFIYNPSIKLWHGIAATLFLIAAGAMAGYFPARAAARVNPIHALRDQ